MTETTEHATAQPDRRDSELRMLKSSYDMYETTKKETRRNMRDAVNPDGTKKYTQEDIKKSIALITEAQNDIVEKYTVAGGNPEDLKKKASQLFPETKLPEQQPKTLREMMEEMGMDRERILKEAVSATATRMEETYIPPKGDYQPVQTYDVIPLPSKGEAYRNKMSKVSVAYLTAYDENMIVSPNLYRDNLIIDYLLQEKLLSQEIPPMDLLEGDRDAIILFLRATGYGNEYPITATDDATGKEFDTVVDLSKLQYKEFRLKGDDNGWFPFTLPVSGKEVKFRFPTHRDIMTLKKLQEAEDRKTMKGAIETYVEVLDTFIENDTAAGKDEKTRVRQAIRTIESWGNGMDEENQALYTHTLTNRLNLLIMSVDGITDKKYISEFIMRMPVRDSAALRKYITENEPGIDYNITIERPQSLGGGSFQSFLQLDKFLFLNTAD